MAKQGRDQQKAMFAKLQAGGKYSAKKSGGGGAVGPSKKKLKAKIKQKVSGNLQKELDQGLKGWVSDSLRAKAVGNKRLAGQIRQRVLNKLIEFSKSKLRTQVAAQLGAKM